MIRSFEAISLHALFDVAADAMLIVDSTGHIVVSNPAAQHLLGYARDELDGLSIEALIPQRYREQHSRHFDAFTQRPIKRSMGSGREFSALNHAGSELPVDISLSPIQATDGQSFTLVTIYSIAKRKQTERLLQTSEERLRLAAEAAQFGTFDADLVNGKLYWSDELMAIIGLPPGKDSPNLGDEFNFLHPVEVERIRALLRSAYRSGDSRIVEEEMRIVRTDGSVRWLLVKGSAQFAGEGKLRRAVRATGIALDITERKNAETALRSSSLLFETIVDSSPVPIAITRLSDGIVIVANEALLDLFGYAREEVIGHTSLELHLWSDPAQRNRLYELIGSSGHAIGLDITFNKKSGEAGYGIVSAARIMLLDEPHVIGFLLDMTERKKMAREILERREEMDALHRFQVAAQTASAFAHELNQPLLAIASYCEAVLILLDARSPDLNKIRKAVEASELQAHRAGHSIRDLLGLLSLNEFPTEVFDLNLEIHVILAAARSEHELEFNPILDLEERLPLIQTNRTHIQKVLLNLLRNSIEVMQEAGVPQPSIAVTVRTTREGNFAQVTIRDNGPGIKAEDNKRLFEPFYTTKTRGIGMGLSISRSLVEANGGQLWLDPQQDTGATFHFTLPFAP